MALVSIIVPVYKVEPYLERCIKSLQNQTLIDIEIILVDDGSPDSCGEICDKYALSDNRIKVIHKKNGGLSSARNAGMRIAQGKYIGFVDSDDDVELDMYERMVTCIERYHTDFIMADYTRIMSDGSKSIMTLDIEGGIYDRKKIVSKIFPSLIMGEDIDYGPLLSVWHCLYDLEFLRKIPLEFDEEVKWSEDNIFSSIMGYHASSFFYMKGEALYHYYQNPGTITTSYRKSAWDVYSLMNDHLHLFFDTCTDYSFENQLNLHLIYYACNCLGMEISRPKEQALPAIKNIMYDVRLQKAISDISILKLPLKLRFQLILMKYKQVNLYYFWKNRRHLCLKYQ